MSNKWTSIKNKSAPFTKEVEVKTKNGAIRKDMIIPVGSYSTHWAGCNYDNLEVPTHWRYIK